MSKREGEIRPYMLLPIVGYMMWHMDRGKSPEDALEMAMLYEDFAGIKKRQFSRALDRAVLNRQACEACNVVFPKQYKQDDGSWGPEKPQ